MYKSILVPVALDHSGRSGPALRAARTLRDDDGTVKLLHVVEVVPTYASYHIPESALQNKQNEAETQLKVMASEMGDATVQTAVIWGHAASTILDYAHDHEIDCIVIASHRPGLQDYFLGSTAARVVRHARCSVHVLR
jgi:universal stress protein F